MPAARPTADAAPADRDPTAAQTPTRTPTPTPSTHERCNHPLNPRRLRRAGSESRGLVRLRFGSGVGVGRWCSPRLAPEATRDLPGVQAAVAFAGWEVAAPLAPPAGPWLG